MPRRRKPNAGLDNRKAKKAKRQVPVHPTQGPRNQCSSDVVVVSDEVVSNVDDRADKLRCTMNMMQEKMSAIAFLFVHKYDGLRTGVIKSGWGGRDGIINCVSQRILVYIQGTKLVTAYFKTSS